MLCFTDIYAEGAQIIGKVDGWKGKQCKGTEPRQDPILVVLVTMQWPSFKRTWGAFLSQASCFTSLGLSCEVLTILHPLHQVCGERCNTPSDRVGSAMICWSSCYVTRHLPLTCNRRHSVSFKTHQSFFSAEPYAYPAATAQLMKHSPH
jgi:hypothetical protein